jgi:hypothetical protein
VIIAAQGEGLPAVLSMIELLRLRDDLAGMHVLVRGDGSPLEQRIHALCLESGIEVDVPAPAGMQAALAEALEAIIRKAPKERPNAYVKGDDSFVRQAREVLFARGMRAWEVHAEILGASIPIPDAQPAIRELPAIS